MAFSQETYVLQVAQTVLQPSKSDSKYYSQIADMRARYNTEPPTAAWRATYLSPEITLSVPLGIRERHAYTDGERNFTAS